MPKLDGYEATRAIRSGAARFGAEMSMRPIIAMTASAIQGDRDKCRLAGMSDYMSKPLKKDVLRDMLAKWVFDQHQ